MFQLGPPDHARPDSRIRCSLALDLDTSHACFNLGKEAWTSLRPTWCTETDLTSDISTLLDNHRRPSLDHRCPSPHRRDPVTRRRSLWSPWDKLRYVFGLRATLINHGLSCLPACLSVCPHARTPARPPFLQLVISKSTPPLLPPLWPARKCDHPHSLRPKLQRISLSLSRIISPARAKLFISSH